MADPEFCLSNLSLHNVEEPCEFFTLHGIGTLAPELEVHFEPRANLLNTFYSGCMTAGVEKELEAM